MELGYVDGEMNELELILYNVGQGLAVSLIEYPEQYVTQIDLGSEGNFSPLEYLSSSRGLRADVLYITHPHADHLSDIMKLHYSSLCPNYMQYGDYDWDDVIEREHSDSKWIIEEFQKVATFVSRGEHNGENAFLWWKRWKPEAAKERFGESSYINNSSLFLIYRWRDFKISIGGDLETEALEASLLGKEFCNHAKNTDILIAPHHGHKSGYTPKWADALGKPYISLISVQNRDPSVATGYYSSEFARGVTIGGETRHCLTIRSDGTIVVRMWYKSDGKCAWKFTFE